MTDAFKVMYTT